MNSCRDHSPTLRIQMSWMQATKRPRMSMSKSSLASFRLPACLSGCLSLLPARRPPRAAAPLPRGDPAPRRDRARRPPPSRGRAGSAALGAGGAAAPLSAWRGPPAAAGERGVCGVPGPERVRGVRLMCLPCAGVRVPGMGVRGGAETALRWAGAPV